MELLLHLEVLISRGGILPLEEEILEARELKSSVPNGLVFRDVTVQARAETEIIPEFQDCVGK